MGVFIDPCTDYGFKRIFGDEGTDVSDYYCKDVTLVEKYSGKVFSNKLRHIFIELPRFMKSKSECDSFFECWIYNLANMKEMNEMTFKDRDAIFGRLEEIASRANLTKEERAQYEYEWKVYNDYYNCLDHAEEKGLAKGLEKGREEGLAEGLAEGIRQTAKNLKTMGLPSESIAQATGLAIEEIEAL